ncbi:beta-ketoacyl-[acyl-carrier-protein] synthase family protein, partial [Patescibacteria group bacterium]|nr:beta-ketoacyl-[acyl-carrier-protein] synthase family protein [Patescibacteria group bacterium]
MRLTRNRRENRVVVTGLGAITPQGNVEQTWESVVAGSSVIVSKTFEVTEPINIDHRGRACGGHNVLRTEDYLIALLPENWGSSLTNKDLSRTDTNGGLLIVATDQALRSACLMEEDRTDIGLVTGTNLVFTNYSVNQTLAYLYGAGNDPLIAAKVMINNAAGYVALKYNLGGINYAVSAACASGGMAIGNAYRIVQRGDANIMLAAGVEGADHPSNLRSFSLAGAYSQSLEKGAAASRPGSATRNGFVMGNGCVVLVLESLESAVNRNANILCEIIGYGATDDASSLYDPPKDGKGIGRAIRNCLDDASLLKNLPTFIRTIYYNAHMTGTRAGDLAEINGLKLAISEQLAKQLIMSFTKGCTGHLLGCAGAIEAMICVMALKEKVIPPTINCEDPDQMLNGFQIVHGKA